ncbi:hypothetical protein B0H10DRAFT_2193742 [Mycena sp. CBHHK59/15]|nr:hypothetical protein B0H10DRAFT_2193742 [Mycena sp. CBHHK59/15]
MTPPPDSTISVAEILVLASFISKHSPVYDLLESSCFYYGRAIFDVTRTLMHCTGADIVTTDDFSFMKSDALQWHAHVIRCLLADKGPAYMVKGLMADKVKTEFGADAIIEKYEAAFAEFEESVRAQKERNQRPLRLAEERRQAAELKVKSVACLVAPLQLAVASPSFKCSNAALDSKYHHCRAGTDPSDPRTRGRAGGYGFLGGSAPPRRCSSKTHAPPTQIRLRPVKPVLNLNVPRKSMVELNVKHSGEENPGGLKPLTSQSTCACGSERNHQYFVGCSGWTPKFQQGHRTHPIPDNVDEDLLANALAGRPLTDDPAKDTPPCSGIIHPHTGLKKKYRSHAHIANGMQVRGEIKNYPCKAVRYVYVPKDPSIRKVLVVHNNTGHTHPIPTLSNVSFELNDTYRQCIKAHGVLGATVSKIDNGLVVSPHRFVVAEFDVAQSTKMLLDEKTPSAYAPPLHNKRVKRDLLRAAKLEEYPHGLDVEGIIPIAQAELLKPLPERYIHSYIKTKQGKIIIVTFVPYLLKLLDDSGVTSFDGDTTYKGIVGKVNEWELTIFAKVVQRASILRAYIDGASADFFEELFDELQRVKLMVTGGDLANQPSKLFTSREEFQQSRTSHIPTGFDSNGITVADATSSISALFTASPPSNARDERANGLANATLQLIRDAEVSLAISPEYDETDPAAVAEMHEKLNAATAVFFNCKHTLDRIRRNVPEMAGARAALGDLDTKIREIEERMKGLDARITAFGAALPPLPYDASINRIVHEMTEDVMKNAEDINAPENPLQFLPQAWDKDTYHTSEAKLLDYERVRFASKAQNLRIQPTSPLREVLLTATDEVIGTASTESPNFERVDYGDDSRAGKLQSPSQLKRGRPEAGDGRGEPGPDTLEGLPAPSGPPEDEENALNPYKQREVVGIWAKPKEKRQEDGSHRDECTTRPQAQDVTAEVEPITSVEVLKSQFQIPMRSTGYLRVPDLELQLNWHIAHPIKESVDSTETLISLRVFTQSPNSASVKLNRIRTKSPTASSRKEAEITTSTTSTFEFMKQIPGTVREISATVWGASNAALYMTAFTVPALQGVYRETAGSLSDSHRIIALVIVFTPRDGCSQIAALTQSGGGVYIA